MKNLNKTYYIRELQHATIFNIRLLCKSCLIDRKMNKIELIKYLSMILDIKLNKSIKITFNHVENYILIEQYSKVDWITFIKIIEK